MRAPTPRSTSRLMTLLMLAASLALSTACVDPALSQATRHQVDYTNANHRNWLDVPAFRQPLDHEDVDHARLAAALYYATNEARVRLGRRALRREALLEQASLLHSQRMTDHGFFDHIDPYSASLRTPPDRARAVGVANPMTAENLVETPGFPYRSGQLVYPLGGRARFSKTPGGPPIRQHTYVSFARAAIKQWLDSPGHRKNLLSPDAVSVGCAATLEWRDDFPTYNAVQLFQLYEPLRAQ